MRIDRSRLGLSLLMVLGGLALFVAMAIVAMWPTGDSGLRSPGGGSAQLESATVTSVEPGRCRAAVAVGEGAGQDPEAARCRRVGIELTSGPDSGLSAGFDLGPGFSISPGDDIRVTATDLPPDAVVGGVPADRYSFADFQRNSSLLWLALAFVALVVITGRWRGARALLGLGASLAIVVMFVAPAILEGTSPPAVALVGALAIMLVAIPVTHGLGPKSVAALLGTTAALLLTIGLAQFATDLAHITGFGSEEASFLNAIGGDTLSIQGLLIAGIVIGALGVLDDLTISQASTVMALRHANPELSARALFSRGMSVGHDHIAAVVNTLVLAYAGAALPVLLVFSLADTGLGDAINSEVVAAEIVATLVGSIGLIAAAPITTGLAALLAVRTDPELLHDDGHGHHH
ncbi:MAG: YibE/F family protein [Miltoncostaeaceae bacterium]